MQYSTQLLKINLQILESILYNAQQDIPKLKISIQFDEQSKYDRFIARVKPIINEDNQVMDDDEDGLSDGQQQQPYPQGHNNDDADLSITNKESDEKLLIERLANLEQSIILKQYYIDSIAKISKTTHTRVLIVPEKIKYFGRNYDDIEEAKAQVDDIKQNIVIHRIQKYGRQVYESNYYFNKITQANIHLIKIAEKYLSWYDESKVHEQQKDDILEDAFTKKYHCMYPLFYVSPNNYKKFNERYITAMIKTKGHIFKNYLEEYLNQTYQEQLRIEVSKSESQLIIHCNVMQQSDMRICQIKSLYENLVYFFINYQQQINERDGDGDRNGDGDGDGDTEITDKITNIKKIEEHLTQKQIFFHRQKHLLVIAYQKQQTKKINESIINQTIMVQQNKKQFVENMAPIFDMNLHCRLQVLIDDEYGIDVTGQQTKLQESISKKIIMQDKTNDRLRVISPKNKKSSIYKDILDYYILTPLLSRLRKKAESASAPVNISVNISSQINDTTTQIIDGDSKLHNQGVQDRDKSFHLPQQVKMTKNKTTLLHKYSRLVQDSEKQHKYKQNLQHIEKLKSADQSLGDLIRQQQGIKYKVLNIKLPLAHITHHKHLSQYKEIITLFVKQKDQHCLYCAEAELPVYLFERSKDIQQNGWLINVDKSMVVERDYMLYVTKNRGNGEEQADSGVVVGEELAKVYYQVIKYLKFVKAF